MLPTRVFRHHTRAASDATPAPKKANLGELAIQEAMIGFALVLPVAFPSGLAAVEHRPGAPIAPHDLVRRASRPQPIQLPAPVRGGPAIGMDPDSVSMASYASPRTLPPMEPSMSTTLETLQAEVLRLSPADRARLLDRLIASLDADAEVEAAWDALADRREAEMDAGAVQAVPLAAALSRLEARFPG